MFKPEDFSLPMETSLRLRVMHDEIDQCKNTDELQKQLKDILRLTMLYQHMLNEIVKRQLTGDLEEFQNAWARMTQGEK